MPEYRLREFREWLKGRSRFFDIFLEVADARAPLASRHPGLERLLPPERSVLVLTRRDLAEPEPTAEWERRLGGVAVNARTGQGLAALWARMESVDGGGRVLVVGLPNLGKSSLLNRLSGRRLTAVGAVPGVTRGPRWLKGGRLEAMDLPGIEPLGSERALLGLLGVLPEGAFSWEEAWERLLQAAGASRLGWLLLGEEATDLPLAMAERWRYRRRGGDPDLERARRRAVDLFRRGRVGPLTLERP